jgi:hypothetical protein
MADDRTIDPETEWLRHVRPEGLVVAPVALKSLGLVPEPQDQTHNAAVAALLSKNADGAPSTMKAPRSSTSGPSSAVS